MAEDASIIRLERLRKEFNGLVAVDDLDLGIAEGEFLCFLGPSGCGKTTTLRMIAGLETPTSGEVYMRGRRITSLPPQQRNVGFMFQNYALFWHMTVYDNIAFGLRVRGLTAQDIDRQVRQVATFLELTDLLDTRASRLDLSAMQRVAMARTLVVDPEVLLLDEPLNNFRPGLREVMRGELKRWQVQLGRTMIYVTHDQEEAMTLGDRILIMNKGKCQQLGTPLEVYQRPENIFVAGFIGRPPMNLIRARYHTDAGHAYVGKGGLRVDVTRWRQAVEERLPAEGEVVLGIRPQDLYIAGPEEVGRDEAFLAEVEMVQFLGRKRVLDLQVDGERWKMVIPGEHRVTIGDRLPVRVQPDRIHLFDPESGRAIL